MYGKYKDISVNVKDIQTCSVCQERPLFLCKDDLQRHNLHYHTSNRKDDLSFLKSEVEMLKQAMLNPDLVIGKRRKSTTTSSIKDLED